MKPRWRRIGLLYIVILISAVILVAFILRMPAEKPEEVALSEAINMSTSQAGEIDKIVEELKTTKISERSGRAQDKEEDYMMQKLRSLGYM